MLQATIGEIKLNPDGTTFEISVNFHDEDFIVDAWDAQGNYQPHNYDQRKVYTFSREDASHKSIHDQVCDDLRNIEKTLKLHQSLSTHVDDDVGGLSGMVLTISDGTISKGESVAKEG